MKLFIYRDRSGKKYPAFVSRLLIALIFALGSYGLVDEHVSKMDFQSTILLRFLICAIAQEWIFQVNNWNAGRYFDIMAIGKYSIIQFALGVVLPTLMIILLPSLSYDKNEMKAEELLMPMNLPYYYHQVILMMNILVCTCTIARTGYTRHLIFKDASDTNVYLNVDEVFVIINTGEECVFGINDELVGAKVDQKLEKDLNNLNPRDFKLFSKGIYISKRLFGISKEEETESITEYMAKLTVSTLRQINNDKIKADLERIKNQ